MLNQNSGVHKEFVAESGCGGSDLDSEGKV